MRKVRSIFLGLSALVLMGSASANAGVSLVGTDVTLNWLFPTVGTLFATEVLPITTNPTTLDCSPGGPGICAGFDEPAAFTIGADTLTLVENSGSFWSAASFNGIEYELSPRIHLTGFTLLTNLSGLTPADVSFTNHSIEFNAEGLSFTSSPYFITLTVSTVPELSTWAMMIFGLAGLGLAGYRSSRRQR